VLKDGDFVAGEMGGDSLTVAALRPDTPAFIFQTSGTTGEAKWVQITHNQFAMAVECMKGAGVLEHKMEQVAYITPPLSHSYGLSSLLEYSSVGSAIALPSGNSPLGPMGDLIGAPVAEMITAIEGVPHVYTQMVRLIERIKLPALGHIGFGGGGLNQTVIGRLRETYPQLTYSVRYGLTETPSVVSHKLFTYPYADDWGSSGKSLPIYELRIVDQTGQVVDPGQQGEIQIKGASLAWPYYGEAGRDDFFATGDIGYINAEQELYIVGRKSAFLKVQDYRISPEYIESIIATFDGVMDCRALGVDSGIVAEVVPAVDSFSTAALRTFLMSKLPSYAIPQTITLVNVIPRTPSGKIKRH
jgi:acyl-coenzyme A synthetase/AMP-(fatty) acid ligase